MIPLGVLASARVAAAGGGGWSPLDLSGLVAWHDASQSSTLTIGGPGDVTGWADLSGNANHMTGTTGVKADGTIGGRAALRTTGDTTSLTSTYVIRREPAPVHYMFMGVFAVTTDTSFNLLPTTWMARASGVAASGVSAASYWDMSKTPEQATRVNAMAIPSIAGNLWSATQGGPFLLTLQYVTTDTLGLYFTTPSGVTGALVGEWILAQTTPDPTTLSAAESYLMTKWGIS